MQLDFHQELKRWLSSFMDSTTTENIQLYTAMVESSYAISPTDRYAIFARSKSRYADMYIHFGSTLPMDVIKDITFYNDRNIINGHIAILQNLQEKHQQIHRNISISQYNGNLKKKEFYGHCTFDNCVVMRRFHCLSVGYAKSKSKEATNCVVLRQISQITAMYLLCDVDGCKLNQDLNALLSRSTTLTSTDTAQFIVCFRKHIRDYMKTEI